MQAIDKVSVVQQAVEQLKTYISSNDLEVGQKLPTEKELCAQLAIGRGSLREALRILAATGYVSQQPGRGAFVMRTKDVSHDKDVINWFETHEVQMKDYLEVRTGIRASGHQAGHQPLHGRGLQEARGHPQMF